MVMSVTPDGRQPHGILNRHGRPHLTRRRFVASDGYSHPLREWLPVGKPWSVVLALHSFGDHSESFSQIGPWLSSRGIAVHAYDQRGFGANPDLGHWAGTLAMHRDCDEMVCLLASRYDMPVFILGESMGGAVAMISAAKTPSLPVAGLMLAAPAVREGIPMRYGWNALIGGGALLLPWLTGNVERPPDDPALDDTYAWRLAHDPRVLRQVRLDTYWGLIRQADFSSDLAPQLKRPVMLMYGGEDRSVPAISIQRLRHRLKKVDYHFYPYDPHLLLHAPHWQVRLNTLLSWIRHHARAGRQDTEQEHTGSLRIGS